MRTTVYIDLEAGTEEVFENSRVQNDPENAISIINLETEEVTKTFAAEDHQGYKTENLNPED